MPVPVPSRDSRRIQSSPGPPKTARIASKENPRDCRKRICLARSSRVLGATRNFLRQISRARSTSVARAALAVCSASPLSRPFARNARRAVLARQRMGARFRVTLVGEEFPPQQLFQQRLEIILRTSVRRELAAQLCAAVLPPREQAQGPLAKRGLLLHTSAITGASTSGLLTPSFSRIFASISAASSGFSLRKSRALSLPWPMRSFLYWYQAPDLSTTPQLTPSSRISPSSDTPSP